MGYIKFILNRRLTDDDGIAKQTVISRFESDMDGEKTLDTNLIMHAMAIKGKVEIITDFVLDSSLLDNDNFILA